MNKFVGFESLMSRLNFFIFSNIFWTLFEYGIPQFVFQCCTSSSAAPSAASKIFSKTALFGQIFFYPEKLNLGRFDCLLNLN